MYYFSIAPMASRRAAIRLLPRAKGDIAIDGMARRMNAGDDRLKVSDDSLSITIRQTEELLILPEYLQVAAIHGETGTKWMLDNEHPSSSLAAGLFGLTRFRTSTVEVIVVSATKTPLSEVGPIALPSGTAMVFQPHRLIGVVQQRDQPMQIVAIGDWAA